MRQRRPCRPQLVYRTRRHGVENPNSLLHERQRTTGPKQNNIEITAAKESSKQEEKHEEKLERQATEEERAPRPVRNDVTEKGRQARRLTKSEGKGTGALNHT